MKINNSVVELIGNTPLLRLNNIIKETSANADILAKLECFNPTGSSKDRPAKEMLDDAEKKGILKKGSVIIEPTSGNTGIGLSAIGASRGYKVIIVMPDTMSKERRLLMSAYGAELVLTDGALGMSGSIKKAEELAKEIPDSFIAGQFVNPANPLSHYKSTGPEIWRDTDGKIDILVAGIGTGGTLSGTGKYLKEKNPKIKIVGVEPAGSPLLTKGFSGKHNVQGIGANFIPDTLDREIYDEIIDVADDDAYTYGRLTAEKEGILVGISSGAAVYAAVKLSKMPENKGKTIVAILTDTGERYLSSEMFSE